MISYLLLSHIFTHPSRNSVDPVEKKDGRTFVCTMSAASKDDSSSSLRFYVWIAPAKAVTFPSCPSFVGPCGKGLFKSIHVLHESQPMEAHDRQAVILLLSLSPMRATGGAHKHTLHT